MCSEEELIREIEKKVDKLQENKDLWKNDRKKLIYNALTSYEDFNRLMLPCSVTMGEDINALVHSNSDAIDMIIRWIFQYSKCSEESFIREVSEELYLELGLLMSKDAVSYRCVCDAYTCWSRKKSTAKLYKNGLGVEFEYLDDIDAKIEKYDLNRNSKSQQEAITNIQYNQEIGKNLNSILSTIEVDESGHISYKVDVEEWNCIYNIILESSAVKWKLPAEWSFNGITIQDFRIFCNVMETKAFIHSLVCIKSGVKGGAVNDAVIIASTDEIINFVCEYSNLNNEVVERIVALFTYTEEYYKKNVDVIWAPFIKLDDEICAISPYLIMSSNSERNLISLINKLDSESYSKVSTEKEKIMITEIESQIDIYKNLNIKSNRPLPGRLPDIDLIIYDDKNMALLMCELKWLLETDSIQEVDARDKDLQKGLSQAKSIQGYAEKDISDLLDRAYGENNFTPKKIYTCVVSMNNIGTSKLENGGINIIDQKKFCELFVRYDGNLATVIDMIKDGIYLSEIKDSINLKVVKEEIKYGDNYFKVQGFKFIDNDMFYRLPIKRKTSRKNKKKRKIINKSKRRNRRRK